MSMVRVRRTGIVLRPESARVFFRPFDFADEARMVKIIARVSAMPDDAVEAEAAKVVREFGGRHQRLNRFFHRRFEDVRRMLISDAGMTDSRRLLIGAYFTQEYSLESAALFNPSIVPHPDQEGVPEGSVRFVLSLRATGEGHISSIVFRSGVADARGDIVMDAPSRFVTAADAHPNPVFDTKLFARKLMELGLYDAFATRVLTRAGECFAFDDLRQIVQSALRQDRTLQQDHRATAEGILSLARANYEVSFDPSSDISERVIFPNTPAEMRGIEDARFVAFREDDGAGIYYATYSAHDGHVVLPQMLETRDFSAFRVSTLNGPEVQNKGMALFPRKVAGRYAMLSRQDNENLYLMFSDMPHFWYSKRLLLRPTFPWEFVQVGNCGSPIETEAGWLVLTHGVGAMRRYAIGAVLLDLEDPGRVIGRLPEPLLSPDETEREGYVPNVVYSCGAMTHAGKLILPYAMSDQCSGFAIVEMAELLAALLEHGAPG